MQSSPTIHQVGIIMNGVTGRMGTNQHLIRSICAIRKQGGIKINDGEFIMPDPILVGRNSSKLAALAQANGVERVTTDLDAALADPFNTVYFDAQTTGRRADAVKKAIAAGKHVYCEKPTAVSTESAYEIYEIAKKAGVKNGVVQDKLWLPGLMKLQQLIRMGFFGKILSVRGEFGYWVFTGTDGITPQRPSWNYRKEDDGGIIVDMLCHWRYVLDNLFGNVKAVSCFGATPRPVWNPDIDSPINFFDNWTRVPAQQVFDNAFKVQWEMFLRHVVKDEPWRFSLLEGAKGVQLAEKGLESWAKRAWVDVPELKA